MRARGCVRRQAAFEELGHLLDHLSANGDSDFSVGVSGQEVGMMNFANAPYRGATGYPAGAMDSEANAEAVYTSLK